MALPYYQERFGLSANVNHRSATMILVGTLFAFGVFSFLNVNKLKKKRPSSSSFSQCTGTDIISQLPDDILISIIARLPIKRAIRTSILSTRWRYLHRSLSNICFKCWGDSHYCFRRHYPKIDKVNRFLRFRSGSKIRKFEMDCCLNNSDTQVLKQCIHSLGRSGVERLVLYCCCNSHDREFSFPCHLLSKLPSLRFFELSSCTLQPSLRSHCSSLQMLVLIDVTVPRGAMECILSNCLSLQELVIRHCNCPSKLCFRAPNLQLKSLRLGMCPDVEEVELCASNLQLFEFTHPRMVNFLFNHVPLLQTVYLDTYQEDVVPYVAGKLAKDVPNLKSLNLIIRGKIRTVSSNRYLWIHMFTNLRRLDVTSSNLPLVILLLKTCPLLQELHLHSYVISDLDSWVEEQGEKHEAIVYYSELKKMEMSGFDGTEHVMELALYILRRATQLEEMRISRCSKTYWVRGWRTSPAFPWNEETSKMIHTRLQGQAVSNNAKLIIQHQANLQDPLWGTSEPPSAPGTCPVSFHYI